MVLRRNTRQGQVAPVAEWRDAQTITSLNERKENPFSWFYPDVRQENGLKKALQNRLRALDSTLIVSGEGADGYAAVIKEKRAVSVYFANDKRLFFANFHYNGAYHAQSQTDCLQDVAKATETWVMRGSSVTTLQVTFPFVWQTRRSLPEDASADEIIEVEWQARHRTVPEDHATLIPLWNAVKESVMLRRLMPVTSHHTLMFSRCTDYPFSNDCPYAVPTIDRRYEVFIAADSYPNPQRLGLGDAATAVRLLEQNLPREWMSTVKGTRAAL